MTSKQLPHSWGVGEDLNSHLLKLGPNISKPTYIMCLRPLYKYFTLLVVFNRLIKPNKTVLNTWEKAEWAISQNICLVG